jgi:hypothetical protein
VLLQTFNDNARCTHERQQCTIRYGLYLVFRMRPPEQKLSLQVMEVKPYVVHQTFQYGGTKGKRHRLREAMLWYDEPRYYTDGKFVHAELDYLPAPVDFEKLPDFNMSLFHLQNMEHQLCQV